jgi:hypothetical protein
VDSEPVKGLARAVRIWPWYQRDGAIERMQHPKTSKAAQCLRGLLR